MILGFDQVIAWEGCRSQWELSATDVRHGFRRMGIRSAALGVGSAREFSDVPGCKRLPTAGVKDTDKDCDIG
jgi:hypothetical protein